MSGEKITVLPRLNLSDNIISMTHDFQYVMKIFLVNSTELIQQSQMFET